MTEQERNSRDSGPSGEVRAERRSEVPHPHGGERKLQECCNHISNYRTAASTRLMEASSREEVFTAIQEIAACMIGSEEVAIFECGPDNLSPTLVWSCGINPDRLKKMPLINFRIARTARTGASYFCEDILESPWPQEKDLTASVVLRSNGKTIGVLAIFRLLPQKEKLEWSDRALLSFLEFHAAEALERARGRTGRPR